MFSLFGKKQTKTKVIDRVFISSNAKNNAIAELARSTGNLVFITWFGESFNKLDEMVRGAHIGAEIFTARQISSHDIRNKVVIFYEHHPLRTKENELFEKLQLNEAIFYSSLDEPLFKYFGGDRIVTMMEKMGMSENEAIEHAMISNAIKNAQEKISEKIIVEHTAQSQEEWFSKNLVK